MEPVLLPAVTDVISHLLQTLVLFCCLFDLHPRNILSICLLLLSSSFPSSKVGERVKAAEIGSTVFSWVKAFVSFKDFNLPRMFPLLWPRWILWKCKAPFQNPDLEANSSRSKRYWFDEWFPKNYHKVLKYTL